jgi:hypothetical protein
MKERAGLPPSFKSALRRGIDPLPWGNSFLTVACKLRESTPLYRMDRANRSGCKCTMSQVL